MKTYLLTAAGVIFLSVVVSLVIPEGKLHKTVTFVMRLICLLVLIQPVTGLFRISNTDTNAEFFDTEYVSAVYSEHQGEQLEILIKEKFGVDADCAVCVEYKDGKFSATDAEVILKQENSEAVEKIQAYLEELDYINITVYAQST